MAARVLAAAAPLTSMPLSGCSPCVQGGSCCRGQLWSDSFPGTVHPGRVHSLALQPRIATLFICLGGSCGFCYRCLGLCELAIVEEFRKVFSCLLKPEAQSMHSYCSSRKCLGTSLGLSLPCLL